MENLLKTNSSLFAHIDSLTFIDSLQSEEVVNLASACFDIKLLTRVFWESFVKYFIAKSNLERQKARLKCIYINRYFGSSIPLNANIDYFTTPHGFYGIFISEAAKLGKGCTIFQNVTVDSNTLLDSKNAGAPTIGDNVYIGAGAKIIGNVKIGNNVRIGAGCSVTRDVPDNCTVVQAAPAIIQKDTPQDNRFISIAAYHKVKAEEKSQGNSTPPQELHSGRVLESKTYELYKNAFKILFCGDLILLEDQVKRAFNGKGYNFDDMFEFTKKYISGADFSIGVFEGPLGGKVALYSQSNYADGKGLYLNFPDEFADAVKNAGFDFVTTATNHLLDMKLDGLKRTVDVLRDKKLDFIGTYKSPEDKTSSRVKLIEKNGIKMAILAYTYGANGFKRERLTSEEFSYITSLITRPDDPEIQKILDAVKKDFEVAKSYEPDLIIVLPHWGTQFADEPDGYQKFWREIFLKLGADIILGDHTHSVQPVKIETVNGRKTFTIYSPGNYANIYRDHDGDASIMTEIYIDRETKKILGGSIIPMWTRSSLAGNYRPLPIYDILTDAKLRHEISTFELKRISYVLKHITRVTLGTELNENMIQERYFFDAGGFQRKKVASLQIDEAIIKGKFFTCVRDVEDVCFIGDSVTHGTRNGGVPWYEPIEHFIKGKIFNRSFGGATIKLLVSEKFLNKIATVPADLFVVAIGTNDVRYRKPEICAMTPEEYISCLQVLREGILKNNPEAKFIFIAPWTSTDGDKISALPFVPKIRMNNSYTNALKDWCAAQGDLYINANVYIKARLNRFLQSDYLTDWIHPNATKGVTLYSEAVLKS